MKTSHITKWIFAISLAFFSLKQADAQWSSSAPFVYTNYYGSSTKVGIGTTTPAYKLDVAGDIYANGGWVRVSGGSGLYFQSYGGGFNMTDATWIRIYGGKSFYQASGTMRTDGTFQVGSNGDRFIINSSGNVGVGATNPLDKLHVENGAIRIGSSSASTNRAVNMLKIGNGDYVKIGEWEADNRLSLYGSNGVSFASGSGKVYFNGNSAFLNTNTAIWLGDNTTNNYLKIEHWNSLHAYMTYGHNLYIRPSILQGTSAIVCQADGKVAIGVNTTYDANYQYQNQGYRLMVNGGILCEEVKVISDVPASDFVFNSDYKLRTLSEIEQFVKENKHLPEVPSAQEFKENGYKVGEMDDLLLRKIEELTLYIIAQDKRIKELEKNK